MRKIVISLGECRLYLFDGGKIIKSYPVAIGKAETPTPVGGFVVRHKLSNPGGPFGSRWMSFQPHYGIHGTNRPSIIGQRISHGSVRMLNSDAEELYSLVGVGTPIKIMRESL